MRKNSIFFFSLFRFQSNQPPITGCRKDLKNLREGLCLITIDRWRVSKESRKQNGLEELQNKSIVINKCIDYYSQLCYQLKSGIPDLLRSGTPGSG